MYFYIKIHRQGFPQKNEKASWYLAFRFQRGAQFARGVQFARCAQFACGAQFAARTVWGYAPLAILIRQPLYMPFGGL